MAALPACLGCLSAGFGNTFWGSCLPVCISGTVVSLQTRACARAHTHTHTRNARQQNTHGACAHTTHMHTHIHSTCNFSQSLALWLIDRRCRCSCVGMCSRPNQSIFRSHLQNRSRLGCPRGLRTLALHSTWYTHTSCQALQQRACLNNGEG